MKYNIIASADYHWGVMDADKQLTESQFILDYVKSNHIDLFVVCGDYFDHRLLMNSKSAINAINFIDSLKKLSLNKENPFKIVMFDGTSSHDFDQLETLRSFEDDNFKIFRKNTYNETLPGLKCLYCPDENIRTVDYINQYSENLFKGDIDIMFFHGTFDVIMVDRTLTDDIPNVIFEYAFYNRITKLMVGGHWHNGDKYGNMYYTRSPYRWKYEEDLPKGMMHIIYDTDTKTYETKYVENKNTDRYYTFYVDTSMYTEVNNYSNLLKNIESKLNDGIEHIRIKVIITDDKEINNTCIDTLINKFQGHKKVKVGIENKYTKKIKKKKAKELDQFKEKYNYIFDSNIPLSRKYKMFIFDTKGIDIPEEEISIIIDEFKKTRERKL